MSSKKLPIARHAALLSALGVLLLALAGCGGAVKVQPTAPAGSTKLTSRGKVDSPLTSMHNHLDCLRDDDHLAVQVLSPTELQVGSALTGATIVLTPTAGAAQARQIDGTAQGAEVIGTALLYPHQASDSELTGIEDCLAQGVQG